MEEADAVLGPARREVLGHVFHAAQRETDRLDRLDLRRGQRLLVLVYEVALRVPLNCSRLQDRFQTLAGRHCKDGVRYAAFPELLLVPAMRRADNVVE